MPAPFSRGYKIEQPAVGDDGREWQLVKRMRIWGTKDGGHYRFVIFHQIRLL